MGPAGIWQSRRIGRAGKWPAAAGRHKESWSTPATMLQRLRVTKLKRERRPVKKAMMMQEVCLDAKMHLPNVVIYCAERKPPGHHRASCLLYRWDCLDRSEEMSCPDFQVSIDQRQAPSRDHAQLRDRSEPPRALDRDADRVHPP